ncbi:MAG: hypothetical protein COA78_16665 [Blastopirellula sp.]|nr:MAG: hypothetical protein COA78_16665 [Blastopirellula sp.]
MSDDIECIEQKNSWGSIYHWLYIGLSTVLPWVLYFYVGWWAALIAIPCGLVLYDYLYVPPGSLCLGMPFMIPLSSSMALIVFEVVAFAKWLVG